MKREPLDFMERKVRRCMRAFTAEAIRLKGKLDPKAERAVAAIRAEIKDCGSSPYIEADVVKDNIFWLLALREPEQLPLMRAACDLLYAAQELGYTQP